MRGAAVLSVVAAFLMTAPVATAAPDYPEQPIQIIVPFTPGGNTDLLARVMADRLQASFNQPVAVLNRPGAGTIIGATAVAFSKPDGYTVLIAPPASFVVNQFIYGSMPYDPDRAFGFVSLVARFPNVLVVPPSSGIKSVRELIDRAKANPGKIDYASAGIGSASHLSGALFGEMAKIDIVHVPYKGTSQSLQDLIAGRVTFTIDNLGPILPFIQSGQLVALGVSTKDPVSLLPGIPPIATVLSGYELSSWNAMAVPAATPKEIVARLSAECDRVLHIPAVIERLRSFGSEPAGGTPEDVTAFMGEERVRWQAAVKAAKIVQDQPK